MLVIIWHEVLGLALRACGIKAQMLVSVIDNS